MVAYQRRQGEFARRREKLSSSLQRTVLTAMTERYPRDVDLALLQPDRYEGTGHYFSCCYVPGYYAAPLKFHSHVLGYEGQDALDALAHTRNSGGRLYSLLLQKLLIKDRPWPDSQPAAAESYTLAPGGYAIIAPSFEGKVFSAVAPSLLVVIAGAFDTLDLALAFWQGERDGRRLVPHRAMLAKVFAVIADDGGWEAKGVKRSLGEFTLL
ncbi:MAG: hypothetical protein QME74_09940 [Candidatus Edwardsbacteria bacterium]|nr:hypothetical protein [Candidatus Edwardsbacteria bacterium]